MTTHSAHYYLAKQAGFPCDADAFAGITTTANPSCHGCTDWIASMRLHHVTSDTATTTSCGLDWQDEVNATDDLDLIDCPACIEQLRADQAADAAAAGYARPVSTSLAKQLAQRDAIRDELEPAGEQTMIPAACGASCDEDPATMHHHDGYNGRKAFSCGAGCPAYNRGHHELDCPERRVSAASQLVHNVSSTRGAGYSAEYRLQRIAQAQRELTELTELLVIDGRAAGLSWADIGDQLGVSKQAVYQKYGKKA